MNHPHWVKIMANDSTQTCIIDWESTTTRPLWAAAHVPAFLQTSPFTSKLFRATIEKLAEEHHRTVLIEGHPRDLGALAAEWLHHETTGARLRMAHRCIEWDGWEEGLVEGILGPEEQEDDWFKSWEDANPPDSAGHHGGVETPQSPFTSTSPTLTESTSDCEDATGKRGSLVGPPTNGNGINGNNGNGKAKGGRPAAAPLPVKVVAVEKEKEKLLNATGDFCGGRGGELGRRLEAWLCVNGDAEGRVELQRRWEGEGGGDEAGGHPA